MQRPQRGVQLDVAGLAARMAVISRHRAGCDRKILDTLPSPAIGAWLGALRAKGARHLLNAWHAWGAREDREHARLCVGGRRVTRAHPWNPVVW